MSIDNVGPTCDGESLESPNDSCKWPSLLPSVINLGNVSRFYLCTTFRIVSIIVDVICTFLVYGREDYSDTDE